MPKHIGSQIRYTLRESGVKLLMMHRDRMLIWDKVNKQVELWGRSDDFAGSCLTYKGKQYEFIRSLK